MHLTPPDAYCQYILFVHEFLIRRENALRKMTQSMLTVPLSCDISVFEFQSGLFRPRGKQAISVLSEIFCMPDSSFLIVFGRAANLKAWREYHGESQRLRYIEFHIIFISICFSILHIILVENAVFKRVCKHELSSQSHFSLWFWKAHLYAVRITIDLFVKHQIHLTFWRQSSTFHKEIMQ